MDKHTAGPWRVEDHTKEGFEVWANGGPTWTFRVAVTGHAYTFDQANAHLIAASPDLLAACEEFVRKCECGEARSKRSYQQMKAAISKAKGEPC